MGREWIKIRGRVEGLVEEQSGEGKEIQSWKEGEEDNKLGEEVKPENYTSKP